MMVRSTFSESPGSIADGQAGHSGIFCMPEALLPLVLLKLTGVGEHPRGGRAQDVIFKVFELGEKGI